MPDVFGSIVALAVATTTVSASVVNLNLGIKSAASSSTSCSGVTKGVTLSARSTARATTSCEGITKGVTLSARSTARATTSLEATVARTISINSSAKSTTTARGISTLSGAIASTATATSRCAGASRFDVLDVPSVIKESLSLWGFLGICNAPEFAISRAINDLNQSMQMVWNNADERAYWSRSPVTLTFEDTQSSKPLTNDIQNVIGPCRRADNKRPLVPVGSIGELETFADLFLGGDTITEPVAYHVERTTQAGNEPAKCVLHVTPPVSGASINLVLDVVKEAPRYSLADVKASSPVVIPHKYVESLLLPILRYHSSTFYLFMAADQKPTIDREYEQAKISLGLADPLPGKAGDKREERPS